MKNEDVLAVAILSTGLAMAACYSLWSVRGEVNTRQSDWVGGMLAGLVGGVTWVVLLTTLAKAVAR